MVSVRYGAL